MSDPTDVDVVIVGAGPAGLACARALADRKVLLLEREARHGGRIQTVDLGGQRVDLGACFAFDRACMPSDWAIEPGRIIPERSDLWLHDGTGLARAGSPRGCLVRAGIDGRTLAAIDAVARLEIDAASLRGTPAHALLDALHHQVHPGDLDDYSPRHQRDGLLTWFPDHWELGNGVLADTLLESSGAEFHPNADVSRIDDRGSGIEVEYRHHGALRRVTGRCAVVATTADVAAGLAAWPDTGAHELLAATRYAAYRVVALAGPASTALPTFRSLVPLHGAPDLVVQQRVLDRSRAVLLCFFRGEVAADDTARGTDEWATLCRSRLAALGIDRGALDALDAVTVRHWSRAGTILSSRYLRARAATPAPGSQRVLLAGDYACGEEGAGYGISDAVRSGLRAARQVQACLADADGRPGPVSRP